ncbi:MAG: hypothetical protein JWN96_2108, partial [Mycobacterium sp.]|nr:hypothetical protein [Mycobacterium sp.]
PASTPSSDLPAPTRAPGDIPSTPPTERVRTAPAAPAGRRRRRLLTIVGAVVVLAIVIGIAVITLGGGDGTKATANPLEIRQLVATFDCTASNPGAPSSIKVTAGQEVVRTGHGGCAVVGPVLDNGNAKVDRASKVTTADVKGGCTVTFQSTAKYGEIVDKASVVNNGYARALVGGGYILDLRARLYAPAKSAALNVVFSATDQAACEKVSAALAKT